MEATYGTAGSLDLRYGRFTYDLTFFNNPRVPRTMIVDRIMDVNLMSLCPQMDMVALVTQDGALIIKRTTSWQRVARKDVGEAVSAICWSPDGRHLAVGHHRGDLIIFGVETGALIRDDTCRILDHIRHKLRISLMWWGKHAGPASSGLAVSQRLDKRPSDFQCSRPNTQAEARFFVPLLKHPKQRKGLWRCGMVLLRNLQT